MRRASAKMENCMTSNHDRKGFGKLVQYVCHRYDSQHPGEPRRWRALPELLRFYSGSRVPSREAYAQLTRAFPELAGILVYSGAARYSQAHKERSFTDHGKALIRAAAADRYEEVEALLYGASEAPEEAAPLLPPVDTMPFDDAADRRAARDCDMIRIGERIGAVTHECCETSSWIQILELAMSNKIEMSTLLSLIRDAYARNQKRDEDLAALPSNPARRARQRSPYGLSPSSP